MILTGEKKDINKLNMKTKAKFNSFLSFQMDEKSNLYWEKNTTGKEINYLHCCKSEECDPNIAMKRKLDSLGFTPKLYTSCPPCNPNSIGRDLTENMKVKPCRIC
jgi:hypothetical protein